MWGWCLASVYCWAALGWRTRAGPGAVQHPLVVEASGLEKTPQKGGCCYWVPVSSVRRPEVQQMPDGNNNNLNMNRYQYWIRNIWLILSKQNKKLNTLNTWVWDGLLETSIGVISWGLGGCIQLSTCSGLSCASNWHVLAIKVTSVFTAMRVLSSTVG